MTTAAISASTSGARSRKGGAASRATATSTAPVVAPPNGRAPQSISYITMPSEKTSERTSSGSPSACSGDMYYLTLADRAFSTCYVAIALSVLQAVYANYLVRSRNKERALRLDRRCRIAFPVGLVVAPAIGAVRAYSET